jgi:integration host factor subunit alpha
MSDSNVAHAVMGDSIRRQTTDDSFRRTSTRADLLDAVQAAIPSLSRAQSREIFEMALEEIAGSLTKGESVKLRSFGLFSVRSKRERIGRNPRTGIEVPITPRRVLTFRPSPVLLALVNGQNEPKELDGDE